MIINAGDFEFSISAKTPIPELLREIRKHNLSNRDYELYYMNHHLLTVKGDLCRTEFEKDLGIKSLYEYIVPLDGTVILIYKKGND